MTVSFKQPLSVLVVIYTRDGQTLLLERADHPGYWQSVTGSREGEEALIDTARREVFEETGLVADTPELTDWGISNLYEIYPHWRYRYSPEVTHNKEHVFGLLVADSMPVHLARCEHLSWRWLPWQQAVECVFSPSNAEALRLLPQKACLM